MYNKIEKSLNKMVGKDIMLSLTGTVSVPIYLDDFSYSINKSEVEPDTLILRNNITELEASISLDNIYNANDNYGELVLTTEECEFIHIHKSDIEQ